MRPCLLCSDRRLISRVCAVCRQNWDPAQKKEQGALVSSRGGSRDYYYYCYGRLAGLDYCCPFSRTRFLLSASRTAPKIHSSFNVFVFAHSLRCCSFLRCYTKFTYARTLTNAKSSRTAPRPNFFVDCFDTVNITPTCFLENRPTVLYSSYSESCLRISEFLEQSLLFLIPAMDR
jgi:hypothetical protein